MFLAAGCVGRLVTFYQPHLVPELAELARLAETTWRTARPDGAASEAYWMEVAEVLAVGGRPRRPGSAGTSSSGPPRPRRS
ncbi:hypothetical protein GCM10020001_063070 [Nonomuraea salmonea]